MLTERQTNYLVVMVAMLIILFPPVYKTWTNECWQQRIKAYAKQPLVFAAGQAAMKTIHCWLNEGAGECQSTFDVNNLDLMSLEVSSGVDLATLIDHELTRKLHEKNAKLLQSRFIKRVQPCSRPSLLMPNLTGIGSTHFVRPVALATAPSGGDVFVRRLLEQLTGIVTGSVYRGNSHLRREGFLAEGIQDSSVVAVTTHAFNFSSAVWSKLTCKDVKKVIVVIRNPFLVVRSEFNKCIRQTKKDDRLNSSQELTCHGDGWASFLPIAAKRWRSSLQRWLDCQAKKLILFLDDLQSDYSPAYFAKIAEFLGFKLSWKTIECVASHIRNLQTDSAEHHVPFQYITGSGRRIINGNIRQLSNLHPAVTRYISS